MLMVNALAGTGKTTTVLWGAGGRVPDDISVSSEQKKIIKEMRKHRGSIAACAFNRSIANELKDRAPMGVECNTSNGFGHRLWCNYIGVSSLAPDAFKNGKLCKEIIGQNYPWKERLRIMNAASSIVDLCKGYLFDPTAQEATNVISNDMVADGIGVMKWLCQRFDVDSDPAVFEYAQKTFIKSVDTKNIIDWNDQVFMPIWYDIPINKYNHLIVDEVQDLNRAKQELAFRMGEYITCVGDVNQAIYGFSGADSDAMNSLWERMVACDAESIQLPMTITRRCPKLVVKKANFYVPELRAAKDAKDGIVRDIRTTEFFNMYDKEPSMILCRVNAPLTSLAFGLIAKKVRCYIQGRDIGTGLKKELKSTGCDDISSALVKVYERIDKKKMELAQREFVDDVLLEALNDKMKCIDILCEDIDTIKDFEIKVDTLFKDSGGPNDIRLSSIHKAKGLEHNKVFIYNADKLKLKAKSAFQAKQENNLAYVAYTRSQNELYSVFPEREEDDE